MCLRSDENLAPSPPALICLDSGCSDNALNSAKLAGYSGLDRSAARLSDAGLGAAWGSRTHGLFVTFVTLSLILVSSSAYLPSVTEFVSIARRGDTGITSHFQLSTIVPVEGRKLRQKSVVTRHKTYSGMNRTRA